MANISQVYLLDTPLESDMKHTLYFSSLANQHSYMASKVIKTYTNEKETVLDFTMGSGSTGVACKNTNRNFIGIEKDDKYFEIAKQRIENGFVQEDVNINENSPLFE